MTTTYEPFTVVDIPFPFIDSGRSKRRAALVLSSSEAQRGCEAVVLAMVTSAERSFWNTDVPLRDWKQAGLRKPSILRWKLFTLESCLVIGTRASLSAYDRQAVADSFSALFSALLPS